MKVTNLTNFQILTLILTILALFSVILLYITFNNSPVPENVYVSKSHANIKPVIESIKLPTRILIPSLAIDANIEHVALTEDGSMGVPNDPLNAGWYKLGPIPGEIGSAVIDGHVDWYYGATGVFKNLNQIKPGDKIIILDENNSKVTFVVRENIIYDATANAAEIFSSNDGQAHLNLITCIGAWNSNIQQYSERLIVFADREL